MEHHRKVYTSVMLSYLQPIVSIDGVAQSAKVPHSGVVVCLLPHHQYEIIGGVRD
jgi:hypothetical protein